jgi:very-short-patch-repair endonuclease
MKFFIFICILVIGFVLLKSWIDKVFRRKYNYTKKEYLMTQPERDCYNVLVKIVGHDYWIFPQVHFSAFLDEYINGKYRYGAFWHINGKSVDFLLCTKERLSPVLAIELDDWSHEREDRKERDREEERMFKSADMPILRIEHKDINNPDYLAKRIKEVLHPKTILVEEKELKWYQKILQFILLALR